MIYLVNYKLLKNKLIFIYSKEKKKKIILNIISFFNLRCKTVKNMFYILIIFFYIFLPNTLGIIRWNNKFFLIFSIKIF